MSLNSKKKRSATILLLGSAAVAPFLFFSSSLQSWQDTNRIVTVFQEILYPFEYAVHSVSTGVTGAWEQYFALHGAAEENAKLKQEIQQLQTIVMDHAEQKHEIKRLKQLLELTEDDERKVLAAEVLLANRGGNFQALRITKGLNHGVRVGMPVITPEGVVGRVIRTGTMYSDVQLLVDSDFHMDVLLQRTRVRGVLSGTNQNYCHLQLHKRADIRIGDTLITSGIVGGFPKGIPVGRVMRISYESDNVAQSITIEPWVDYKTLEEVLVIFNEDRDLSKIIDAVGTKWLDDNVRKAMGG